MEANTHVGRRAGCGSGEGRITATGMFAQFLCMKQFAFNLKIASDRGSMMG